MEKIKIILTFTEWFFILYLMMYALILASSVIVGALSIYDSMRKRKLKNVFESNKNIKISIIVPAYNEEITIMDTIKSLTQLDYSGYEIIVVNDGSKDKTLQKIIDSCNVHLTSKYVLDKIKTKPIKSIYIGKYNNISITVIDKENGGKADSLNCGINVANNQWFVCMDADSVLQSDALKKVIAPILENDSVIASGGAIMISNGVTLKNGKVEHYDLPKNLLASMQVVEYNRTFLASRIMFDKFNANLIISGAFGLFNKDIVIAAGGYEARTRGEDMELVIKLHTFCRTNRRNYKIKYVPEAICWTQAPEDLKGLMSQRKRWHVGLHECMKKYRYIFLKPQHGLIGSLAYLYFLLYEFLSPYIEIAGVFVTILMYILNLINIKFMFAFYIFYTIMGVMISVAAYCTTVYMNELAFDFKKLLKVILLCFCEIGALRFILSWVRFTALFGYNKNKYSWGKIQRKEMKKVQ